MESIKDKKLNELKEINDKIDELKHDEKIKSYNYLSFKKDLLTSEIKDLYKEKYSKCHHLFITTYLQSIKNDNKKINYAGCIKCGLNEKILFFDNWYLDHNKLNIEEQAMFDYVTKNGFSKYYSSNDIICDLELAQAIFKKIKEVHPKINDKLALKYLEIALDNIRDIPMTDDRKESRIKRLGLNPKFNKWYKDDITK